MVVAREFAQAEEVAEFLSKDSGLINVAGSGSGGLFRPASSNDLPVLRFMATGCSEVSPADQVAVVKAGTEIADVQEELRAHGQALPLAIHPGLTHTATLAGSISLNLPHPLEGLCGSWRDWVLGMTVVLANGEIVKCGSKAVKNVAGYDLHKLFIGARGTLGVITEVVVRTYPLSRYEDLFAKNAAGPAAPQKLWIQRTLRTDFPKALRGVGPNLMLRDERTSTLWADGSNAPFSRFKNDWVIQSGQAPCIESDVHRRLMLALKSKLDPHARLNPGEFGFL